MNDAVTNVTTTLNVLNDSLIGVRNVCGPKLSPVAADLSILVGSRGPPRRQLHTAGNIEQIVGASNIVPHDPHYQAQPRGAHPAPHVR